MGFDAETCGILAAVEQQSPDIARGVDSKSSKDQGAGDQGLMFGYAVNEARQLIESGPYRLVRHPRYLMVTIGIIGWALVCNYLGTYLVSAASIGGLWLIIAIEERELVNRFGARYRDYQARVPRLVPSMASAPP